MTITKSRTMLIASIIALALMVPAFSFAASDDLTKLQSQFQLLMERFESFKNNRGGTGTSTATSTKPIKDKTASSTVNRTCMATAVGVREASVKTAWTTFSGSMVTGLDKRATALIAAWNGSADGSNSAIKTAWSTWRADNKAAHTKLRTDRKAAWETFKKTAKDSCKVTTPKEEGLGKEAKDSVEL
jgi:hypothetical protein